MAASELGFSYTCAPKEMISRLSRYADPGGRLLSAPSNLALGDALGSTSLLVRQVTAGRRLSLSQPIAKCALWRATRPEAWRAREGSIVGSDRLLESFCAVQGSYTRAWPRDSDEEEILSILVSVTLSGLCDFSHTPTTPCCCLTHRTFRRRYDCTTWVSRNWCNAAMPPSLRARWEDTSVWRALDT